MPRTNLWVVRGLRLEAGGSGEGKVLPVEIQHGETRCEYDNGQAEQFPVVIYGRNRDTELGQMTYDSSADYAERQQCPVHGRSR